MSPADYIAELKTLGYEAGEAQPGVLFVRGHGVASYFPLSDPEGLDSMIDPGLHAERVEAFENPLPLPAEEETLEERVAVLESKMLAEETPA